LDTFVSERKIISVGSRDSSLSRAQVREVQAELDRHQTPVELCPIFLKTHGDRDRLTSLRSLDQTDFFTREIDELQRRRGCRLSLHSAKDLPDPLPDGLVLAALTRGVDSSDSLVMRTGETLHSLAPKAKVATSSVRREENVRRLRRNLTFVDVRGLIEERLAKLDAGEFDALVVAEAALLRLGLTARNRLKLPGKTAARQGQLAILARTEDLEGRLLVSPLDSRKRPRILYLGLDPSHFSRDWERATLFHYPVIAIRPRPQGADITAALKQLPRISHVIFTSKSAVRWLLTLVSRRQLRRKRLLAIGEVTAAHLHHYGLTATIVAAEETAEGLLESLEGEELSRALTLWPHGNRARSLIPDYFRARDYPLVECVLYDTILQRPAPPPPLEHVDQVIFTSPSTVDGFLALYKELPDMRKLVAQGPITGRYLEKRLGAHVSRVSHKSPAPLR
jgi:hydroxymethylbilane synthase